MRCSRPIPYERPRIIWGAPAKTNQDNQHGTIPKNARIFGGLASGARAVSRDANSMHFKVAVWLRPEAELFFLRVMA